MAHNPIGSRIKLRSPLAVLACALALQITGTAEPVAVRYLEKPLQATLALRSSDGTLLADGTLDLHVSRDRVTSRLTFKFKDGSLQDQTTVFSQQGRFKLVSDRIVQRGPSFTRPLEMTIDAETGQVNVTYMEDGREQTASERLQIPSDLANGMLPTLLKNLDPASPPSTVSLVAATPRPRLVGLRLSPGAAEAVRIGGVAHRATHYVIKAEVGGVAGVFAPLVGKQPPDTHAWVITGDSPAFLKSEGPLFYGGPSWRIEVTSARSSARGVRSQ
jgi:hypothetical protein